MNVTLPSDIAGPSSQRRSSSPLSIYTSDIVYPIAEHTDEQAISSIKRSSAHSDDDDDDDDEEYVRRNNQDDDDMYGDIDDDLDIEIDSSHSPLLATKRMTSSDNNGEFSIRQMTFFYLLLENGLLTKIYTCVGSFNRKKRYVDSLTRKYKHVPKTRNEIEIDDMFKRSNSEPAQKRSESLTEREAQQTDDFLEQEPPLEDGTDYELDLSVLCSCY